MNSCTPSTACNPSTAALTVYCRRWYSTGASSLNYFSANNLFLPPSFKKLVWLLSASGGLHLIIIRVWSMILAGAVVEFA